MSIYTKLVAVETEIAKQINSGNLDAKKLRKLFVERARLTSMFAYEEGKKEAIEEIPMPKVKGNKKTSAVNKITKEIKKLLKKDNKKHKDILIGHQLGEKFNELAGMRKATSVCKDLEFNDQTRYNLTKFYKATTRDGVEEILKHAKEKNVTIYRTFFITLNEGKFQNQRQYTQFAISCIDKGYNTATKVHDAIVAQAKNCASEMERTCILAEKVRDGLNALVSEAVELGVAKDAQ